MGDNDAFFSQEQAAPSEKLLAAIGRALREQYATAQPLPDRLAELVMEIEQSNSETKG